MGQRTAIEPDSRIKGSTARTRRPIEQPPEWRETRRAEATEERDDY